MSNIIKKYISLNIWVAIVVFVFRLLISLAAFVETTNNGPIATCAYLVFSYASESVAITATFMVLFNKLLWRLKPFNALAGHLPILAKNYHGKISYESNEKIVTKDIDVLIEQTFLHVSIKLKTDESYSSSVTAVIETINNQQQLIYTYLNIPNAEIQKNSQIHFGTVNLIVDNPNHIMGNYYTGRMSRGSIELDAV